MSEKKPVISKRDSDYIAKTVLKVSSTVIGMLFVLNILIISMLAVYNPLLLDISVETPGKQGDIFSGRFFPALLICSSAAKSEYVSKQVDVSDGNDPVSHPNKQHTDALGKNSIRTATVSQSDTLCNSFGIYLQNFSNETFNADDVLTQFPFDKPAVTDYDAPLVLVIHTFGRQSYAGNLLSDSETENAVRIGKTFAAELRARGITVIHDKNLYDSEPDQAYSLALEAIDRVLEENPTIKYVVDIQRDVLKGREDDDEIEYRVIAADDSSAQIRVVCGTPTETLNFQNWRRNLSFGLTFQKMLSSQPVGSLARPLAVLPSRLNQNLSEYALTLLIGSQANSLSEAISTARYAAAAFYDSIT